MKQDAIQINNITKRYRANKLALSDVTAGIGQGLHGVLGENGAGKTTLFAILSTFLDPTAGSATIFGLDIKRQRTEIRRLLAFIPQEFGLYRHLTCRQVLEYMASLKEISGRLRGDAVEEALAAVNLDEQADKYTWQLSSGMRRRLGIAQGLLGNPRVMLIDEPTAGLDPLERNRVRVLLAELAKDRVILLSTHIVEDIASTCEHVLILRQGLCVYNGSIPDLISEAQGRIWSCSLTPGDFAAVSRSHLVLGCLRQPDRLIVRVVSHGPPAFAAEQVPPTLEDAYLSRFVLPTLGPSTAGGIKP